jgi:hypothetical protein
MYGCAIPTVCASDFELTRQQVSGSRQVRDSVVLKDGVWYQARRSMLYPVANALVCRHQADGEAGGDHVSRNASATIGPTDPEY